MARRMPAGSAFAAALLLAACGTTAGPPPRTEASTRGPRVSGKSALFGPAHLLPTREGERIRAEAARAAEVQRLVEALPEVASAAVDVELPRRAPQRPGRVVVVVQATVAGAAAGQLARRVQAVAAAAVPEAGGDGVSVHVAPVRPPAPGPAPPAPPLLLLVLALGASLGVLGERLRRLVSHGRLRIRKPARRQRRTR